MMNYDVRYDNNLSLSLKKKTIVSKMSIHILTEYIHIIGIFLNKINKIIILNIHNSYYTKNEGEIILLT